MYDIVSFCARKVGKENLTDKMEIQPFSYVQIAIVDEKKSSFK